MSVNKQIIRKSRKEGNKQKIKYIPKLHQLFRFMKINIFRVSVPV